MTLEVCTKQTIYPTLKNVKIVNGRIYQVMHNGELREIRDYIELANVVKIK